MQGTTLRIRNVQKLLSKSKKRHHNYFSSASVLPAGSGWFQNENSCKESCRLYSTSLGGQPAYSGVVRPGKYSYLSVPGELPLVGKTLGQLVDSAAEKFGDGEALVVATDNQRLSFAQVKAESDKLASGFLKLGLAPGDRIGIWGPNSRQWYIAELAAAKAGLISVFINPAYQTRELFYSLNKVGMKCIVIAGNFKTQNYHKLLLAAVPELENISSTKVLKSEKVPTLSTVVTMEDEAPAKGIFTYNQVLNEGSSKEAAENLENVSRKIQFDDVVNIQFTSGTTGNPKGVMLSHNNVVNNSFMIGKRLHVNSKDKVCLTVPLFHCYGNVAGILAALHRGASVVFPSPGFDPQAGIKTAAQERCTLMYGTPTMHIDMLNVKDLDKYDLSSLRSAVTAGAICPMELIKEMKEKYTVDNVTSLYGLTETSPVFFQSLPGDSDELRAETVGYPQEHVEVKVVNKEGKIVPVGTEGEILTRGYMVMHGYWEDPEKTKESIDMARWFHSGDLFIMTETGHGKIVGRLKDMIIRGGENIYPKEVEEFLHTHPSIVEAQVFGVPDKRLGETVAAWIRLKDGTTMTEADLKAFCKGQISHFKIPQYIKFTGDFPKTTSGKIQKYVMRDRAVAEYNL